MFMVQMVTICSSSANRCAVAGSDVVCLADDKVHLCMFAMIAVLCVVSIIG
jgi:hypothetical protein